MHGRNLPQPSAVLKAARSSNKNAENTQALTNPMFKPSEIAMLRMSNKVDNLAESQKTLFDIL